MSEESTWSSSAEPAHYLSTEVQERRKEEMWMILPSISDSVSYYCKKCKKILEFNHVVYNLVGSEPKVYDEMKADILMGKPIDMLCCSCHGKIMRGYNHENIRFVFINLFEQIQNEQMKVYRLLRDGWMLNRKQLRARGRIWTQSYLLQRGSMIRHSNILSMKKIGRAFYYYRTPYEKLKGRLFMRYKYYWNPRRSISIRFGSIIDKKLVFVRLFEKDGWMDNYGLEKKFKEWYDKQLNYRAGSKEFNRQATKIILGDIEYIYRSRSSDVECIS